MPHHENLQQSGFMPYSPLPPVYPSSTDSDSLDRSSTEPPPTTNEFSDQSQLATADEHFFVGDLDLEFDPWRRNVPSPMPRITDAITQALAEAALSPLSPTIYSPWDGEFAPPAPGLNEYATMQAQSRGRGPGRPPPPNPQQQPQSQAPPQYQEEHPLHPPDIYYRYTEASSSLPTAHTQPFTPIYMSHNPSPTLPHHQHQPPQYASSITSASSPAPLSDAEAEAKRIRNTAASARFRRKKKAREASLERQSREKREALAKLENRITELEDENKFLKGLILWKREGKEEGGDGEGKGKGAETEESIVVEPERKGRERKDGVGT